MENAKGFFLSMMPSLFGSLRALGFDSGAALAIHAAFALPALLAAVAGMLWCDDRNLRAAILVVATVTVTPYSLAYDLGAVSAIIALAPVSGRLTIPSAGLLAVAAFLPLVMVPLGLTSLLIAPLTIIAVLALLLHRAGIWEHFTRAFSARTS